MGVHLVRNIEGVWLMGDGGPVLIPEGMTGEVVSRRPGGVLEVRWHAAVELDEDGLPRCREDLVQDDVLEGDEAEPTTSCCPLGAVAEAAERVREDALDHYLGDLPEWDEEGWPPDAAAAA